MVGMLPQHNLSQQIPIVSRNQDMANNLVDISSQGLASSQDMANNPVGTSSQDMASNLVDISNRGPGGYQQGPYGTPPGGAQSPLGPTSMGMQPNIEAGLSYVLGWVTGLIFFLMEKQNRFVRFHAMQSILFFGGLTVIRIILSFISFFDIPFLGLLVGLVSIAVGIIGLVGYIILLINGFQGKYYKLPIVGDYAEKYANQGM